MIQTNRPKCPFDRVLTRAVMFKLWHLSLSRLRDAGAKAELSNAFRHALETI
jgi:hypothetical protein